VVTDPPQGIIFSSLLEPEHMEQTSALLDAAIVESYYSREKLYYKYLSL